ncbi:MAG: redoxin family protein [Eubacteriales bacterium]|nr:redoxin family protein [Eubacteriales bacterium]
MFDSKKILSLCLSLLMLLSLAACQAKESTGQAAEQEKELENTPEQEADAEVEAEAEAEAKGEAAEESPAEESDKQETKAELDPDLADSELTLTAAEREKGTTLYFPVGAKYNLDEKFNQNANFVRRLNRGFEVGPKVFIKSSREHFFRPDGQDEAKVERYKDVDVKNFPLFGIVVVDKERQPESEAEFKEAMIYPNLELIADYGDFAQYFGYGDYDQAPVELLDPAEQELYKELLATVPGIREGIYFFTPQQPVDSIGSVRDWQFESELLDGSPVDQSILAEHKVSLISYMTTWCPHCVDELPIFQAAKDSFLKEVDGGIIGIYADLVPEAAETEEYQETMASAEKLIKESKVDFPIIQNSYSVQDSLSKYAMNYPTNFFVNSNGDVLSVHVGAYEDLEEAFKEAIKAADKLEAAKAAGTDGKVEPKEPVQELSDEELEQILNDPELTLSPKEREENYVLYAVVGAKFQDPEPFTAPVGLYNRRHRGFDSGPEDLIRMSREYYFSAQVRESNNDSPDKYLDYPLYGLFVLNKENLPDTEEELIKELGFQKLKKTYEDDYVVQYLAFGEKNTKGLEENELAIYEEYYDSLETIEKTFYGFRALPISDSIGRAKNWDFKGTTLDGQEYGKEIFKEKAVTLVSYMTTWCPHCINELPLFSEIGEEQKDSMQILYIIGDYMPEIATQEESGYALETIHKLFEDVKAKDLIFPLNYHLDGTLTKFIMNYPTNFLVDSDGNVIKVRVGAYDEESLKKDLKEAYELLNTRK